VDLWPDVLELIGPDYLCTTIAIAIAVDVLFPPTAKEHEMDELKQKMLDRLDVDRNGRVNLNDATAFLEAELAKRSPRTAAIIGFVVGVAVATVIAVLVP
jgi:hypothetical protein